MPSRMTDVQLEFHRIDPFVRTTLKVRNDTTLWVMKLLLLLLPH